MECLLLPEVVVKRCSTQKLILKISTLDEACNFIKRRDSDTGVSQWILQNFFSDNSEWSSKKLWKMISADDVKAKKNIKK